MLTSSHLWVPGAEPQTCLKPERWPWNDGYLWVFQIHRISSMFRMVFDHGHRIIWVCTSGIFRLCTSHFEPYQNIQNWAHHNHHDKRFLHISTPGRHIDWHGARRLKTSLGHRGKEVAKPWYNYQVFSGSRMSGMRCIYIYTNIRMVCIYTLYIIYKYHIYIIVYIYIPI